MTKVCPIPIGGEAAEHSGAISGYLPMDGHHTLAIKFAYAGAMEVTVIYRAVGNIRIAQSHVSIHSS
jgi:hypothetical protein